MEFIVSSILGGILYDLIKEGTELTIRNVFGNYKLNDLEDKVCGEFISEINEITDVNDKKDFCKEILSEENRYTKLFENNLYKTNFAKRLDYVIFLMNDTNGRTEKYNIEKLGKKLGFSSVNDLKKYYIDSEEPTYEFIEKVAQKLGINVEWIQYGDNEPFKTKLRYVYDPYSLIREEEFKGAKEIIFAMQDDIYEPNLGVIIKVDDLRYDYYPQTYTFHSSVGATGAAELLSLYKFLNKLNQHGKMPSGVYKIPLNDFSKLFNGQIYPASVYKYRKNPKGNLYLLEDFITLYKSRDEKKKYADLYGKVFVECQDIIKEELNNGY